MIKQMRASYFHNFKNAQYCALSDDPIPDDLENGDEVYIIDQGKIYYWDESSSSLYEYKGRGGGSGGSSSFVPCFGSLATVSLGTTWSGDDPYVSTVTVTGYTVTNQTMVSVLPSSDVVEQMLADGITNIFITNNDGVLTATAIGATPTVPMTLQVLCTESNISGDIAELPSIVGSGIIETVEADNLTDAVNILGEDVDDLKNAIDQLENNVNVSGKMFSGSDIIQGGVATTGELAPSDKTIRVGDLQTVKKGDYVVLKRGATYCLSVAIAQFDANGTYITSIGWVTSDIAWVADQDSIICLLFRKNTTAKITPSDYDATSYIVYRSTVKTTINAVEEMIQTKISMSDVYEHGMTATSGNMYIVHPEEVLNRGRVKEQYIQKIPDGATLISYDFVSDIFANGKYKCSVMQFDADFKQILSTNWITSAYSGAAVIGANSKYWMVFYASVNDSTPINFGEIPHEKNIIVFDNSNVNYAWTLLNQPSKDYLPKIQDKLLPLRNTSSIISINHRGYSAIAPENTLPAYILSRKKGFEWVETDICFTSDNVPVLMHDLTINRTGRNADGTAISGTVYVSDITYAQLETYDFGIWLGQKWAGLKAPTLTEYLTTIKKLGLKTSLDIKDGATDAQVQIIIDEVVALDMLDSVIFGAFESSILEYIASVLPNATLGIGGGSEIATQANFDAIVATIKSLRTGTNNVFLSAGYQYMQSGYYATLQSEKIPLCLWTINSASDVSSINPYAFAVMSDYINVGDYLANNLMDTLDQYGV